MKTQEVISIFLADDDDDDCLLFREALDEIPLSTRLTTVPNGEQLMTLLKGHGQELPHVLFLDLNMPRKNGWQCLEEIKQHEKLKSLSVVVFSTSFQQDIADQLYSKGTKYYLRKPSDFNELKSIIHQMLTLIYKEHIALPGKNPFPPTKANNAFSNPISSS